MNLAKSVRCYAVKTPTGDLCTQTVSADPSKPLAMLAKWLGGYTEKDLDEMGYRRVVVDVSEPDLYADPPRTPLQEPGGKAIAIGGYSQFEALQCTPPPAPT